MKISELKVGTNNVNIKAKVIQKDEPREVVTKYGKRLNVANISLEDETGTISMSLWGNDINEVNVGDMVEVSGGYVNEFRDNPQLSTGKFGKIKVVEKSGGSEELEESEEYNSEESEESEE
ncbi:MAG: OB-fold nucleic acid binding domain-containing protein [Candidatus Marsarchaeota archaeon]|nr:OB-fold nucleic acid binding domain-containing protein [Candidatus Marsarchaeota archaeon]MCL5094847.1 OB-fold nucleic acid binding domain-containing protein [Candidatus Marsarchaeota archaeon]